MKRYAIFLIAFLSLSILISPFFQFYEGGLYIALLKSITRDFDFNIVNHVSPRMAWLVTRTYSHPDFHPETQSAPLLFLYGVESVVGRVFSGFSGRDLQLSALALSCLSLLWGFKLTEELSKSLKVNRERLDYLFFYLGCSAFYYSFFATTVLEITAFPLISYVFLSLARIREKKFDSPWTLGVAVAFLSITKVTYAPFCVYVLGVAVGGTPKKKRVSGILGLALPLLIFLACDASNRFLKYGEWINPIATGTRYLLVHSPLHVVSKAFTGLFFPGGILFTNAVYGVALYGLFLLFKQSKRNGPLRPFDYLVIGIWLIPTFFTFVATPGTMLDDHWPGRHVLAALPVLLVGFSKALSSWRKKLPGSPWILPAILCAWHLVLFAFYMIYESKSSYLFPSRILPTSELFRTALVSFRAAWGENVSWLAGHLLHLIAFSMITAWVATWKPLRPRFIHLCAATFLVMSLANLANHQRKIDALKSAGFYEGKVVGAGPEIYAIDYIIDVAFTYRTLSDQENVSFLNQALEKYYSVVEKQVVRSTPTFDRALRARATDFSFWIPGR